MKHRVLLSLTVLACSDPGTFAAPGTYFTGPANHSGRVTVSPFTTPVFHPVTISFITMGGACTDPHEPLVRVRGLDVEITPHLTYHVPPSGGCVSLGREFPQSVVLDFPTAGTLRVTLVGHPTATATASITRY